MKNKKQAKRLNALDWFIIIIVLVCAVAIGIRFFSVRGSDVNDKVELENYVISFEILDIKNSSAQNYMDAGTNFYLQETNEFLGTLREGITVRDAQTFYEMPDGTIVWAQNTATGDLYRVDVEASLDARGKLDANGSFLLGGNRYIGMNKEVKIYSKYLAVTALITGIVKAE